MEAKDRKRREIKTQSKIDHDSNGMLFFTSSPRPFTGSFTTVKIDDDDMRTSELQF